MACAASIWNWAISNFNPILFMPFKTDFGRGTENKQKKSKLGHPNMRVALDVFSLVLFGRSLRLETVSNNLVA